MWQKNTKIIAIGDESFIDVRKNADLFIDKSLLIDAVMNKGEKAILLTSPRRWGKSLNLDMIKIFYQLQVDENGIPLKHNSNRVLFEGGDIEIKIQGRLTTKHLEPLNIATINNGSYLDDQGKYPVILVNLKDAGTGKLDSSMQLIALEISDLYKEHNYLIPYLSDYDKEKFEKYLFVTANKAELQNSIKFLSNLLYHYHKTQVIILVDEYDSPANHMLAKTIVGEDNHEINEMISFVSSMFGACGKAKEQLKIIILTGIYNSIKKINFSGFNNINAYGILDTDFNEYLGFSEADIDYLINIMDLKEYSASVKKDIDQWYNGYTLPGNNKESMRVYAPWSILNHLANVRIYLNKNNSLPEPKNYWASSGGGAMLGSLIQMIASNNEFTSNLRIILPNMSEVTLAYRSDLSLYNSVDLNNNSFTEEIITYLMFHSGYLSARRTSDGEYLFRIPNKEVKDEFLKVISRQILRAPNSIAKVLKETEHSYINYNIEKAAKALILKSDSLSDYLVKGQKSICSNEKINLFHLSIILNDANAFKTLLSRCDNKALDTITSSVTLKAFELASILRNDEIKSMIPKDKQIIDPLIIPKTYQSYYCYPAIDKAIIVTFGAIAAFTSKYTINWQDANYINFIKLGAKGLATLAFKEAVNFFNKQICSEYNYYHGIKLNSLLGFKKYIQEHPDTIITNDTCPNAYVEVANTTLEVDDHNAALHLCALGECEN